MLAVFGLLDVGCCLLFFFWLLAVGCWLPAVSCSLLFCFFCVFCVCVCVFVFRYFLGDVCCAMFVLLLLFHAYPLLEFPPMI